MASIDLTPQDASDDRAGRMWRLAECLLVLDRSHEAIEVAAGAVALARDPETQARAALVQARAAVPAQGPQEACRILERALDNNPPVTVAIELCEELLLHLSDVGRMDDVDRYVAEIERLALVSDEPDMVDRATSRRVLYDFQSGRQTSAASLEMLSGLDQDVALVQDATINIAMWADRVDLTEQGWGSILQDCLDLADVTTEAEVLQYQLDFDLRLGNTARIERSLARLGTLAEDQKFRTAITWLLSGSWSAACGDFAGAQRTLAKALDLAADTPWLEARCLAALATPALMADDLGRAAELLDAAAAADPDLLRWRHGVQAVQIDRIEACAGSGSADRAAHLLAEVTAQACSWGDGWVAAAVARSRAHVLAGQGDLEAAKACALEAVEGYGQLPYRADLGRAQLLAGVVARRMGSRREARLHLAAATDTFTAGGAHGWSGRVEAERARLGGRAPNLGALTASEQRVAELVASGLTNAEIARRLSLSVRTVESHVSSCLTKLGVRSRTALCVRLRSVEGGT